MSILSLEKTSTVARNSVIAVLVVISLFALIFVDQSIHWLIETFMPTGDLTDEPTGPGLWFLLSLFYFSAATFGFTVLFKRSDDIGVTRQTLLLGGAWAVGAVSLFALFAAWETAGYEPLLPGADGTMDALLFTFDQIARGAFFDLFEVTGWSFTDLQADTSHIWLAATLVIFRTMTSVGSVVVMIRVLGLRSQDVGLE